MRITKREIVGYVVTLLVWGLVGWIVLAYF